MKRSHYYWLFGALLIGLLVRIPGVFWGHNFPVGWYGHHVDERAHLINAQLLINPLLPPVYYKPSYPKGMGAHVAIPMLGIRFLEGKLFDKHPPSSTIIVTGRVLTVLYGTATILIVYLLTRLLFGDPRLAHLAAWIMAMGGLHISQSHFFLADVPSIFWFFLGLYLLLLELEAPSSNSSQALLWAAFCFGIAFGIKLVINGLLSLALIALMYKPRLIRSIKAAIFFLAGFVLVNFLSYTPYDLYVTFKKSVHGSLQFSRLSSIILYLIELPSIVSFPVLLLTVAGSYFLIRKLFLSDSRSKLRTLLLIVILPLILNVWVVVFKLDHFPRHLIPFIPWIAMVSAWSLLKIIDRARLKGLHPSLVVVPFFVYLALFVYDGEKVFIKEPRNMAAKWLLQNVPPGTTISWSGHGRIEKYNFKGFPHQGRPPVIIVEMAPDVNSYLSGMGLKNSCLNSSKIIEGEDWSQVRAYRLLFKGETEYKEVARFSEGYFMPDYVLVNDLIGDRSRNFVSEIVIFKKTRKASEEFEKTQS
jgi:hypothetical protein